MSNMTSQGPSRAGFVILVLTASVAMAILLALGTWQVERLAWKEAMIARIEARIHASPEPLPATARWPDLKVEDYEYRHVRVSGRFDQARETLIFRGVGKVGDGAAQPGYWVMVPLLLPDGASLLVNRGFVPLDKKDPASRAPVPPGEVTLTGLMRVPEDRSAFTPADDPAKGQWYTRDPVAIAAAIGLPRPAPFSLDEDAHAVARGEPGGGATVLDIPNNHLSYAATWYGLAATLAVMLGVVAWRRRRSATAQGDGLRDR